jgi:putative membrane protein
MIKTLIVGTAVLTLAASPAFAQAKKSAANTGKSSPDQMFVKNAAAGGMAEVELGKLAAEKAASQDVKQFGQKMADDHGKANDELKSIAQSKNIQVPSDLKPKDKALMNRLSKLSGPAFDRAYMQAMLADHRHDVSDFKRESQSGKDPEVKAFAAKTLPTLQEHLKMAQDTDKSVVGTSGSGKGRRANTRAGSNDAHGAAGNTGTEQPSTTNPTERK